MSSYTNMPTQVHALCQLQSTSHGSWSEVLNIVRLHVDSAEGVPGSISSVSRRWRSGERPWACSALLALGLGAGAQVPRCVLPDSHV